MRDEMDARMWNEHGPRFSDDVARLAEAVRVTFCKLAAIQFRAPWRKTEAC